MLSNPNKFQHDYRALLHEVMTNGTTELNERTETEIRMIEGGASFKLSLRNGRLPVANNRAMFPHIAAAEVAWQFMGTQDPTFIMKYAPKLWSKFLTEDLETGDEELETAYGYRWMKHFGRNQLKQACSELMNNPTNRQLFVSAWDPAHDGLGGDQPPNIPCPLGFTVSRSRDICHMTVPVRSSDVFVGLPYDVMGYALTLDAIASTCGLIPGTIMFALAHPHVYEPHFEHALHSDQKELQNLDVEPNLPGWSIADIVQNPEGYVELVKRLSSRKDRHPFNPMPDVVV